MADELVDVINENNEIIGTAMKSEVHQKGLRHRVAAVLLQNDAGKYLIPTASDKKVEAGGLFHSAAGHVQSGDSYDVSACRELWEETGLTARPLEAELMGSFWVERDYPTRIEKERFEVYKVKYTQQMGEVKLNEEQINEQWFSEEELKNIFLNDANKLSFPLSQSCKYIFKFE